MKNTFIAMLILLCSCDAGNNQNCEKLKSKIDDLEKKVDSIQLQVELLKNNSIKINTNKFNPQKRENVIYSIPNQAPKNI